MTDAGLLLKEHDTPEGLLVAVCDAELIGRTFADDGISLTVTEGFYGGDPTPPDGVVAGLAEASVANLVGHAAVDLAIEHGFVDADRVLDVGETRHAQIVVL